MATINVFPECLEELMAVDPAEDIMEPRRGEHSLMVASSPYLSNAHTYRRLDFWARAVSAVMHQPRYTRTFPLMCETYPSAKNSDGDRLPFCCKEIYGDSEGCQCE
ncbi:uncharacterized protein ARMOST_15230 [Armillaria ostoyae]|uniref:Uncharacterized protein n=1 Tax=Armillaria ostoyae TaxID=47428 RepID=A0A284RSV4_ARMOS|nr:uncharacterized protein ARMOST_15230 [Armillaria ostoyae]